MTLESQQFSPLRWVKKELDILLTETRAALEVYVEDAGQTAKLEEARRLLDQVEGTLQLLELQGASMLAREMSALTRSLESGDVTGREDAYEVLMRTILQLPDYLEHLRVGHRDVPLVLLPLLNDLRTVRKAPLLSEGVFFFPDLAGISGASLADSLGADESEGDIQDIARVCRHQYQRGLISLIRGNAAAAGAKRLEEAVAGLRRRARVAKAQRFFWIVGALAEALRSGGLEAGVTVKQLLGQVDRQIRDLIEHGEAAMAARIPEELQRNLLYYVGRATSPGVLVSSVQEAYRLKELLPGEAELRAAQEGLSAPNQELMLTVSNVIREDLADVKDSLDVFMHTGGHRVEELRPLANKLRSMADTMAMVGMAAPREIALHEADILESIMAGQTAPDEAVLMHAAANLLNMEGAISAAVSTPGEVEGRKDLSEVMEDWSTAESRALLSAVLTEGLVDLARVKDAINAYVDGGDGAVSLDGVPEILDGLIGALSWLSLDDEVFLLQGMRGYIQDQCSGASHGRRSEEDALLADVLTAVECSLEVRNSAQGNPEAFLESGRLALACLQEMAGGNTAPVSDHDLPAPDGLPEIPLPEDPAPEAGESEPPFSLGDLPELDFPSELSGDVQWEPLPGLEPASEAVDDGAEQDLTLLMEGQQMVPPQDEEPAAPPLDASPPALESGGDEVFPRDDDSTLVIPRLESEAGDASSHPDTPAVADPGSSGSDGGEPLGLVILTDEADQEILDVFLEEADEEAARIAECLPRWQKNPEDEDALSTLRRSFHTIKGSGRLVGAQLLGEFAWVNENLLNRLIEGQIQPSAKLKALLDESSAMLPHLVAQIRGEAFPHTEIQSLMQRLRDLGNEPPDDASEQETLPSEAELSDQPEAMPRIDRELMGIYGAETRQHLRTLDNLLDQVSPGRSLEITPELLRAIHTLNGSARTAEIPEISSVCGVCERYLGLLEESGLAVPAEVLPDLRALSAHLLEVLSALGRPGAELPTADALEARFQDLHAQEKTRLEAEEALQQARDAENSAPMSSFEPTMPGMDDFGLSEATAPSPDHDVFPAFVSDEPDQELISLFLEEAVDILHAADATLDLWAGSLSDQEHVQAFQRQLHTLKGGARMTGITAIGDLSHALESLMIALTEGGREPEAPMIEVARQALDQLNTMVEQAGQGETVVEVPQLVDRLNAFIGDGDAGAGTEASSSVELASEGGEEHSARAGLERQPEPVIPLRSDTEAAQGVIPSARTAPALGQDVVRLRSDVLDNLVNHAGEVNIFHARMEQQITGFGFNLGELEQTIQRLREQLRKLELETEAQILFRHEQEQGEAKWQEDFDPLELDRYSNIQQLSRALAESISDLTSIQGLLSDQVKDTETLLLQQSRVSTDLQEGLMRTRMVQFATIVPRLRRIIRQTASELGKRVELDVEGEGSELDRSVLERMMAPMEHMLRNAISHGIESPDERRTLGKNETGHVRLSTRREGSEVVLEVSDDGAGIDLDAVRARVERLGLAGDPALLTEQDLMQFILESGFSTASQISQISGRGVGLDVVNSEIKQLGGILAIDSTRGKGTVFTIRLPFTLAISQALLVQAGDELFAIPLSSIEGIMRMQGSDLADYHAAEDPTYEYAGNSYEVKHLGALLKVSRGPQQIPDAMYPVLLVRSGDHRIALHVDLLLGSREIVIKQVGPQVSRVKGIAGATILGDGRVVMILDIPALVRVGAGVRLAYYDTHSEGVTDQQVATIMVVDDSITIRKVTARALERQGYQVHTARDGVDAVAQLQELVPDLMLLDIEMPRMDGFELATHIRNDARLRHMPIIMITSRTGDKHRQRAMEIGVNRYLGKPYQEMDLLTQIREVLADTRGAGGGQA